MHKAVFLDRDGVLNRDTDFPYKIEDCEILNGALEATKRLTEAGYKLFIVTNQSGIGRDIFTENNMREFNDYLVSEIEKAGGKIEKVYFCPHKPDDGCNCRKPNPHFVLEAQKEFDIDLSKSYFVGDRDTDIECGKNAGVKESILVDENKGLLWAVENIILK